MRCRAGRASMEPTLAALLERCIIDARRAKTLPLVQVGWPRPVAAGWAGLHVCSAAGRAGSRRHALAAGHPYPPSMRGGVCPCWRCASGEAPCQRNSKISHRRLAGRAARPCAPSRRSTREVTSGVVGHASVCGKHKGHINAFRSPMRLNREPRRGLGQCWQRFVGFGQIWAGQSQLPKPR